MKNLNKKGFTIIELVIVIAVIAILAAVLIPTFNSVISKANESAAMQEANAALKIVESHEVDMSKKIYYFYVFDTALTDGDTVEYNEAKYVYIYDSNSEVKDKDNKTVVFYNAKANVNIGNKANTNAAACIEGEAFKAVDSAETLKLNAEELKDLGQKVAVVAVSRTPVKDESSEGNE